jgi:two-component system, NtrC family, response regulator HydG
MTGDQVNMTDPEETLMRAKDLKLVDLLDVDSEQGVIRFAGQPAIILDAVAMGLLRKQLVSALGPRAARSLLTRFAYAHGFRTAEALRSEFTWDSARDLRDAGGLVHALQGYLALSPEKDDPFSPRGATLLSSYEVEQHLLHLGRSDAPICWTLAGFASGYLSCMEGRPIFVLEDRCVGQGDAACHFRARGLPEWGDEIKPHLPFYQEEGLTSLLKRLSSELRRAESKIRKQKKALVIVQGAEHPSGIIARSSKMRHLLDLAQRVAKVDSTVLVGGESGSGKERIARLLHESSARAAGPFVAINCAAIIETLLESELFGHVRGAFTGAIQDRVGLFEAAFAGTLFLDEIGELSLAMQAKLLRVVEERTVRRVGENKGRPVNVRVIAATNRDLATEVSAKRFRKDLYYRLNVVELMVPPLRTRRDDILPLARVLLTQSALRMKREISGIAPKAADLLVRYPWPGNVRELENAMERAVALAQGKRIDVEDLPENIRNEHQQLRPGHTGARLDEIERAHILAVLTRNQGNQTLTAAELGIGASTLYRKLKGYNAARKRRE